MVTVDADLTDPAQVMARLGEIERDLANRQGPLERAASEWYTAKRDVERVKARALLSANPKLSITEKKAHAELQVEPEWLEKEAVYEALKAVHRTLEHRAMILMALLKSLIKF